MEIADRSPCRLVQGHEIDREALDGLQLPHHAAPCDVDLAATGTLRVCVIGDGDVARPIGLLDNYVTYLAIWRRGTP
ncbi:hypothetical protein BHE74_00036372 [Ensete ventricosum]|nr:hypothetical protein BHE74_00036372 [Ensete ventricosum]